ncbi:MAG TPA: preprotein translocase subunit SecA, partial [Candidatus Saccharimonadales bacterium]|nr:preprotein translocase subunit SecA [Candidatus Saccharimonadales bacterium]
LQATLRGEIVRALFHITKRDATIAEDTTYDTELTKAAENAVEQGVNELGNPTKQADFEPKAASEDEGMHKKKNNLRKKRKKQRQNKKKKR